MLKKLALLGLSALILGGCSLQTIKNSLMGNNNAAQDAAASPAPTVTTSPDAQLQSMPSTAPGNDDQSLETDINSTSVVNEDFSNLGQ